MSTQMHLRSVLSTVFFVLLSTLAPIAPMMNAAIPEAADVYWDNAFAVKPELGPGATLDSALGEVSGIYVGGSFTEIGGVAATNIAFWDGVRWQALGRGLDGRIYSMVRHQGTLYAGGQRSLSETPTILGDLGQTGGEPPATLITKWDGFQWTELPGFPEESCSAFDSKAYSVWQPFRVAALGVGSNQLHALVLGSYSRTITTSIPGWSTTTHVQSYAFFVYRWDGSQWISTGWHTDISGPDIDAQRCDESWAYKLSFTADMHYVVQAVFPDSSKPRLRCTALVGIGGAWVNKEQWIQSLTQNGYTSSDVKGVLTVGSDMYVSATFKNKETQRFVGYLLKVTAAGGYSLEPDFATESVVAMTASQNTIWAVNQSDQGFRVRWKSAGVWHDGWDVLVGTGPLALAPQDNVLTVASASLLARGGTGIVVNDLIARFVSGQSWSRWHPAPLLLDGEIRALKASVLSSPSYLTIAGDFTGANGKALNHVAGLDGTTSWYPIGTGVQEGPITAMLLGAQNEDYMAVTNIYRRQGTTWTKIPVQPVLTREVPALNYIPGYGGVTVSVPVTTCGYTYDPFFGFPVWNCTTTYTQPGSHPAYTTNDAMFKIEALAQIPGGLVAGGRFVMDLGSGRGYATNLALWDGTAWSRLGDVCPDRSVRALVWDAGNLYVGGRFANIGSVACAGVAKWDGQQWLPLGSGLKGAVSFLGTSGELNGSAACMAAGEGYLVVGGEFTKAGEIGATNIARWNGATWEALGDGINGKVRKLVVNGTEVYAAGSFTEAGGIPANSIAWWHDNHWEPLGTGLFEGMPDESAAGSGLMGYEEGDQDYFDESVIPGDRPYITGLALTWTEGLYVSGRFAKAGGKPCPGFARWTSAALNQRPKIAMVPWPTNTVFQEPATITVEATASDADGRVVSVDFTADGKLIGHVTTPPYKLVWRSVSGGDHVIMAKATDEHGSTASATTRAYVQSSILPATLAPVPLNQSVWAGQKAAFGVAPPSAVASYGYQWYHEGLALTDNGRVVGARSAVLTISKTTDRDAGEYHVVLTSGTGSITSQSAQLEVRPAEPWAVLLRRPEPGATFTNPKLIAMEVAVENPPEPITEVWYYISGPKGLLRVATSKTPPKFAVNWTTPYNGEFEVWALGLGPEGLSASSERSKIVVTGMPSAPIILGTRPERSPIYARIGSPVFIEADVAGPEPLNYQWLADGKPIVESASRQGTQTPKLILPAVQLADNARYRLVVTNAYGEARTAELALQVMASPLVRFLPETYTPGVPLQVRLSAMPKSGTQVYAIEEQLLPGWTASQLGDGVFDSQSRKLKFGPYFDDKPRTFSYTAFPPDSAIGRVRLTGTISYDATYESTGGDLTMEYAGETVNHPADTDLNNRISIQELTKFAVSWRKGTFVPIDWKRKVSLDLPGVLLGNPDQTLQGLPQASTASYLTRAAMIWKKGEAYYYLTNVAPPLCWTNDIQLCGSDSGLGGVFAAMVSLDSILPLASFTGPAGRELPTSYVAGQQVPVTLRINPAADVIAYAVEEQTPPGWVVMSASDEAEIDSVNGTIRWGPFFDNQARVLTYQITPPAGASGFVQFSGLVSIDGEDVLIGGSQALNGSPVATPVTMRFESVTVQNQQLVLRLSGYSPGNNWIQASSDMKQWQSLTNCSNLTVPVELALPWNATNRFQYFRAVTP